jgi:hypothetical protein
MTVLELDQHMSLVAYAHRGVQAVYGKLIIATQYQA